eukprot:TRINITY_DN5478_c0_g1_i1.p1 TRINITY_DN5478_c0_g1~~TRINITY_DN5478_c0_g1_i1.p1  ORF type:complete len:469 (+),score=107.86 TRINITY_DN5478_c0_g1_i1:57-1409(+)
MAARSVSVQELSELVARSAAAIVDVRGHDKYGGYIPGSLDLPAGSPARPEDWCVCLDSVLAESAIGDATTHLVFVCMTGTVRCRTRASQYAALGKVGVECFVLEGGFAAWVNSHHRDGAVDPAAVCGFESDSWRSIDGALRHTSTTPPIFEEPQSPRAPALILIRHGHRLDYSERDEGRNWIPGAARPWDPPLTCVGLMQAEAAGLRVKHDAGHWGVRRPSTVYTSPFTRCGQTALMVAAAIGAERICVENGFAERMDEKWFRSWAVPGANSKMGGPPDCRMGVEVRPEDLKPEASGHPADWMLRPADVGAATVAGDPTSTCSGAVQLLETSHESVSGPEESVTWGEWDSDRRCADREVRAVLELHSRHPGESLVVVGHGGPLRLMAERLLGRRLHKSDSAGYCCLYVLRSDGEGGWKDVLVGCDAHAKRISDVSEEPGSPTTGTPLSCR